VVAPSIIATQEFVVPRSIPMTFDIEKIFYDLRKNLNLNSIYVSIKVLQELKLKMLKKIFAYKKFINRIFLKTNFKNNFQ
jgi:hypothetical protein